MLVPITLRKNPYTFSAAIVDWGSTNTPFLFDRCIKKELSHNRGTFEVLDYGGINTTSGGKLQTMSKGT